MKLVKLTLLVGALLCSVQAMAGAKQDNQDSVVGPLTQLSQYNGGQILCPVVQAKMLAAQESGQDVGVLHSDAFAP